MGGFGGVPGGFAPFFAGGNPGGVPLWGPPAAGNGGPNRRGGRPTQQSARAGPYDRQQRPRYGDNSGRLSPPGGAMGGGRPRTGNGAGGRWGDGAGGGAAAGPREAVQGRSLKNYDDLDAVSGSGSGELNY